MVDKQILCAFGVDLDAVGGWLGSYGGEDSPDDISRGVVRWRGGHAAVVEVVPAARHHHDLVHSRALYGDFSRRVPNDRR